MTTPSQATLKQALADAQARGVARIDTQMLLLHALGRPTQDRAWLIAHDTDTLTLDAARRFETLVLRRMDGEPVAYVTGVKEFFGLQLLVDPRVLDPRPETETLVAWALDVLDYAGAASPETGISDPRRRLIDLGTGSGAIALAVKHARPDFEVIAVDSSADALVVARGNAARLHLPVHFIQGEWLESVTGQFHVIVANPPYVAAGDSHLAALNHEPLSALASGPDGLGDIRQIVRQAPAHLLPGGWLLLEHGWDQAESVRALLEQTGFTLLESRSDLAGIVRCTGGKTAAEPATGGSEYRPPDRHGPKVK